jgi:hypothetical protein
MIFAFQNGDYEEGSEVNGSGLLPTDFPDQLPFTGTDLMMISVVGAFLLIIGLILILRPPAARQRGDKSPRQ